MTPDEFTAGLLHAATAIGPDLTTAFKEGATDIRDKWKSNARASSGAHARKYPGFITSAVTTSSRGVMAEIGPLMSGQGNLGSVLEFGSENNPAHLDGQRATTEVMPLMERRFDAVIGFLLP